MDTSKNNNSLHNKYIVPEQNMFCSTVPHSIYCHFLIRYFLTFFGHKMTDLTHNSELIQSATHTRGTEVGTRQMKQNPHTNTLYHTCHKQPTVDANNKAL